MSGPLEAFENLGGVIKFRETKPIGSFYTFHALVLKFYMGDAGCAARTLARLLN